jgi:hypothetical protein
VSFRSTTGTWLLLQGDGGVLVIATRRFSPAGASINMGLITPGVSERVDVPQDAVAQPRRLTAGAARGRGVAPEI